MSVLEKLSVSLELVAEVEQPLSLLIDITDRKIHGNGLLRTAIKV